MVFVTGILSFTLTVIHTRLMRLLTDKETEGGRLRQDKELCVVVTLTLLIIGLLSEIQKFTFSVCIE